MELNPAPTPTITTPTPAPEPVVPAADVQTPVITPEPESKQSIIQKIADKVQSYLHPVETNDTKGDFLPDEFSKACLEQGWSEDDIKDFTEGMSDEQLLEMIPEILGNGQDGKPSPDPVVTEPKTPVLPKTTPAVNSQEDETVKKLLERIEALENAQGKTSEDAAQKETESRALRATQLMDDLSKEYEVFGQSDKLPEFPDGRIIQSSPQVKARLEVWNLANQLNSTGMGFEKALTIAVNAFKGSRLEKDAKRNVVKELNHSERLLSPKRTSHDETTKVLQGSEVIRAIAAKHGRTIN